DVSAGKNPRVIETMKLGGETEGFAVDDDRHLFFTNLEDKDKTLVIEIPTRGVVKAMSPECGEAGPRGLAVDSDRKLLMVACTDHVVVLDEGGRAVGRLDAGEGIDNLDYVPATHRLYVAAARAGTLTIAELGASGELAKVAVVPTTEGARNAIAVDGGKGYPTRPAPRRALLVTPRQPPGGRATGGPGKMLSRTGLLQSRWTASPSSDAGCSRPANGSVGPWRESRLAGEEPAHGITS